MFNMAAQLPHLLLLSLLMHLDQVADKEGRSTELFGQIADQG
jgi:hypothetical protein